MRATQQRTRPSLCLSCSVLALIPERSAVVPLFVCERHKFVLVKQAKAMKLREVAVLDFATYIFIGIYIRFVFTLLSIHL